MKRPRPLTADERQHTTATLTGLVAEFERADAGRIQQLIGVLMDSGYPATASGAATTGGTGGGDTVLTCVEAKASRPDRTATDARVLALRLHRFRHDADEILRALRSMRSDRPVSTCAEGHVLDRVSGGTRCQYVDPDTGRRCGTADVERRCDNCNRILTPGQKRRKAIAVDRGGAEVSECDRCHAHRRRHGISWGDATRLTPQALGAYSSDDPWIGDHTNA